MRGAHVLLLVSLLLGGATALKVERKQRKEDAEGDDGIDRLGQLQVKPVGYVQDPIAAAGDSQ